MRFYLTDQCNSILISIDFSSIAYARCLDFKKVPKFLIHSESHCCTRITVLYLCPLGAITHLTESLRKRTSLTYQERVMLTCALRAHVKCLYIETIRSQVPTCIKYGTYSHKGVYSFNLNFHFTSVNDI